MDPACSITEQLGCYLFCILQFCNCYLQRGLPYLISRKYTD